MHCGLEGADESFDLVCQLPQVHSGLFWCLKVENVLGQCSVHLPCSVKPSLQLLHNFQVEVTSLSGRVQQFLGLLILDGHSNVVEAFGVV